MNLVDRIARIRIELKHAKSTLFLSVEDDGPGVGTADLSRLTERFYRAQLSRTTPGNGLGLTLVSAVANLHGGKLCFAVLTPGLSATLHFQIGRAHV